MGSQLSLSSDRGDRGERGLFFWAVSHHPCKKHPQGVACLEEGNASPVPVLYYASHVEGLILSCGRKPLLFYSTESV